MNYGIEWSEQWARGGGWVHRVKRVHNTDELGSVLRLDQVVASKIGETPVFGCLNRSRGVS